jgi:hypothetical protein
MLMAQKGSHAPDSATKPYNFFVIPSGRKRNGSNQNADQGLLGEGGFFRPTAVSALSKALVETTEILGIEGDEIKRQAVARVIIRLAREDASLDVAALRVEGMAGLISPPVRARRFCPPRAPTRRAFFTTFLSSRMPWGSRLDPLPSALAALKPAACLGETIVSVKASTLTFALRPQA